MSQIMESMVNRGLTQNGSEVVPYQPPQQGLDIVKILWRWKWLPILGSLIGAGVGYMFFTKMPQMYMSWAMVQVGYSLPATNTVELYDPDKVAPWTNRNDEARVIRSQAVLTQAVKLGNLVQHFPEMTEPEIVFELMEEKKGVQVVPAEQSDRIPTEQLVITYRSQSPEIAHAVVRAVVDGYSAFLKETYRTVDDEALAYFTTTEQNLAAKISEMDKEWENFRKQKANVLWNVDQAVDPYFESYKQNMATIDQLRRDRIRLKSKITQVTEAQKNGRKPEDLLLLLSDGNDMSVRTIWDQLFKGTAGDAERISQDLMTRFLIPAKFREQELLKTYGANHPSVLQIQSQIRSIEGQISVARQRENLALKDTPLAPNGGGLDAASDLMPADTLTDSNTDTGIGVLDPSSFLGGEAVAGSVSPPEAATGEGALPFLNMESSAETIAFWVQMSINALMEKYQQTGIELKEVEEISKELLAQSQELQHFFMQNNRLQEQLKQMKELYSAISDKVSSVELAPTSANHKVLRELNPASSGMEDGPYAARYVIGGAVLGILLMSGLAILMDLADRSYRSPDEIVADLGKPVLGHVPAMDLPNIKKVINSVDASIITLHHSRGRIAEAFRSVRTGLFFSSRGSELKVVQVTSPVPGDGKSTLSANLAVTMAQSGRRVLLMDADFRRPRLHKLFGLEIQSGLAQVVSGEAELDDAIYTTCIANLTMMPGGKRPNNPAELLSSNRFAELVELLREKYDIIIIDTPPLLAVSDPSVVASIVDGVVLTMRLRRNVKPLATRAFRVLESVDAQILGVVVNGVSTEAAYGGYGYNYSYNDYRYSYRSNYNYGYGYRKYSNYAEYSAGYIEEKQTDPVVEADLKNDANPQS